MEQLPQIDLSNISPTTVWIVISLFLMGVVELFNKIGEAIDPSKEDRNWSSVAKIAGAAVAGALVLPMFGNFFTGLNPYQLAIVGMVLGFNASGAITLLSYFGKKASSPVEVVVPATTVPVIEQPELETDEGTDTK